jgi:hypothetical protein
MVRTDAITALRRIVEIRASQEAAARMQLGRLAARRRELDEETSETNDRMERERISWSSVVSAAPLDLALVGAWYGAVHESNGRLRLIEARYAVNDADVELGKMVLRTAQVRADVARGIARRTARRSGRRAAEAALNEIADRLAHRDLETRGRSE